MPKKAAVPADTNMFRMAGFAKIALDFALMIIAAVVVGSAHDNYKKNYDSNPGNKYPYFFNAFYLKPLAKNTEIDALFTTIQTTDIATVDTNAAAVLTRLEGAFSACTNSDVTEPEFCRKCLLPYSAIMDNDWDSINTSTYGSDANVATVVDELERDLTACIYRHARDFEATHAFMINPWAHLFLWCGLAFTCSILTHYDENHGVLLANGVVASGVLACTILGFFWFSSDNRVSHADNGVLFDAGHVLPLTLIISAPAIVAGMARMGVPDKEDAVAGRATMFSTTTVLSSIPMAVIVACFNEWLEYNLLQYTVVMTVVIFLLSSTDDVCNVMWVRTQKGSETDHAHRTSHFLLTSGLLFAMLFLWLTNFPSALYEDEFAVSVPMWGFIVFMVAYTVTPSFLFDLAQWQNMHVLWLKECLEFLFRLTVVVWMWGVYDRTYYVLT